MSKIKKTTAFFERQVLRHLQDFMQRAQLYPPEGGASLVGVSGGVDSMVLAWALGRILAGKKHPPLHWIHVNHGLRSESGEEEAFVREQAERGGHPLQVFPLGESLLREGPGNLEAKARRKRWECFGQGLKRSGAKTLYLGHHIDDSFEWFLLQQFLSSKHPATLGIPLVRGVVRRPLHCFTKRQIHEIAQRLEIPHREDGSNRQQRFDRNFIRHSLVSRIEKRFPQALKNYVFRANEEAQKRGQSAFARFAGDEGGLRFIRDRPGSLYLVQTGKQGTFRGREAGIKAALGKLSKAKRGRWRNQVEALIQAQEQGREGPLDFSGGVRVFMGAGGLLLMNRELEEVYRDWDKRAAAYIQNLKTSQIPEKLLDPQNWKRPFKAQMAPFWLIGLEGKDLSRPLKSSLRRHPLFPHLMAACRRRKLWIRSWGQISHLCRRRKLHFRDFYCAPLAFI